MVFSEPSRTFHLSVTGGTTHLTVREAGLCHQRQPILGIVSQMVSKDRLERQLQWSHLAVCAEVALPDQGRAFRKRST